MVRWVLDDYYDLERAILLLSFLILHSGGKGPSIMDLSLLREDLFIRISALVVHVRPDVMHGF